MIKQFLQNKKLVGWAAAVAVFSSLTMAFLVLVAGWREAVNATAPNGWFYILPVLLFNLLVPIVLFIQIDSDHLKNLEVYLTVSFVCGLPVFLLLCMFGGFSFLSIYFIYLLLLFVCACIAAGVGVMVARLRDRLGK